MKIWQALNKQPKKYLLIELIALAVLVILFNIVAFKNYKDKPGVIDKDEVEVVKRTDSMIHLRWERQKNADEYIVYYRASNSYKDWGKKTIEGKTDKEKIDAKIKSLKPGTKYAFVLRAANEGNDGLNTDKIYYKTKNKQKIEGRSGYTKLTCVKNFKLDAKAKTKLKYKSSNKDVVTVDKKGNVTIHSAGKATIHVTAPENKNYVQEKKDIGILALDSKPVKAGGATTRIIYRLNGENCKVVKKVSGQGSIHVPQGLAYTGEKYIIAYGMGGAQRIITFDVNGKGKAISVPKIALGHPNGFTYSEKTGLCYSVKGWSSRAVTYDPKTGKYGKISLPYGCSGIAYDRKNKCFYTSSRTAMRRYSGDGKFKHEEAVGVIRHKGVYTQDCGGHAGIMFYCMSGGSKHGTNYVDLYDMRYGNYLGTFSCDLSEIESAVVDDEGYMEILSNNSSKTDYIYKTPINIETLAEGIK